LWDCFLQDLESFLSDFFYVVGFPDFLPVPDLDDCGDSDPFGSVFVFSLFAHGYHLSVLVEVIYFLIGDGF